MRRSKPLKARRPLSGARARAFFLLSCGLFAACAARRPQQPEIFQPSPPAIAAVPPAPAAPAPPAEPGPAPAMDAGGAARIETVLAIASDHVGRKRVVVDQTVFPFDCSNFVRAAVLGGGTDLFEDARGVWDTNGAGMIQRWAQNRGRFFRDGDPAPGDLVFWDNTYDRNHNGLWDDPLTHIGIVEHVDADGQITFIHKGAREITRGFMNLRAPSERRRNGREINSWLRWASPGKDEGADRLAGNLFAGYARVYGPAPQPPARAEESPSSGGGSRREDGGGLRPSPIFRASPDRHQRMEGITP